MGKGSGRRPSQITSDEEQARWDAVFGTKDAKKTLDEGGKVIDLMDALKQALKTPKT